MPRHDQSPQQAGEPGDGGLEQVWAIYLGTDIRPAIRAAGTGPLRRILAGITGELRHYLHDDIGGIPALPPDDRRPSGVCQAGPAMRAGFRLYHHLLQVITRHYLQAAGFDPAQAAAAAGYPLTSGWSWPPPPAGSSGRSSWTWRTACTTPHGRAPPPPPARPRTSAWTLTSRTSPPASPEPSACTGTPPAPCQCRPCTASGRAWEPAGRPAFHRARPAPVPAPLPSA